MPKPAWPAEKVERAREMWAEGATATIIAERIGGVTRSAVLGMAHRQKWPARPPRPPLKISARKRPPTRGNRYNAGGIGAKLAAGTFGRPPAMKREKVKPVQVDTPEPASLDVALLDLTFGACRWPVNDPPPKGAFLFCGQPAKSGSYCKHHHQRAYARAG